MQLQYSRVDGGATAATGTEQQSDTDCEEARFQPGSTIQRSFVTNPADMMLPCLCTESAVPRIRTADANHKHAHLCHGHGLAQPDLH